MIDFVISDSNIFNTGNVAAGDICIGFGVSFGLGFK
jgi:hypothetical protein